MITTPYDFLWNLKNPQDYWVGSDDKFKYVVYKNGIKLGKFYGVIRSGDDDIYNIIHLDKNGYFDYFPALKDSEMILERK